MLSFQFLQNKAIIKGIHAYPLIVNTKRTGNRFFILGLIILLEICWLITIAAKPAMTEKKFPSQGLIEFPVTPAPKSDSSLRVVTYNIGYASADKNNRGSVLTRDEVEKNLGEMIGALKKFNPDIVALQEVDFNSSRSFGLDQFKILAEGLGLPHTAYVVTWNKKYVPWPYWPPSKHFGRIVSGQAVLSRYPIKTQKLIRFEKPAENSFWYNWFYLDRIVQDLFVDVEGKALRLFNLHFESYSAPTRLLQAKKLAGLLPLDPNLIVLGDFNSASHWGDIQRMETSEDSAEALEFFLKKSGLTNTNSEFDTYPAIKPDRKIDHVLVGNGFEILKTGVLGDLKASDHLAFWVELKW